MKRAQRERLKDLFEYNRGRWIPLPQILAMGIAQYNARIFELRREGMQIENTSKTVDGAKHTWFRYNPEVKEDLFG